jgi:hypothetical protein
VEGRRKGEGGKDTSKEGRGEERRKKNGKFEVPQGGKQ